MILRWLCCSADVRMLLLVLFKLIGFDDASDDACVVVVVMLFAFDVFVCSCALDDDVVVTTVDTVVSATVAALNKKPYLHHIFIYTKYKQITQIQNEMGKKTELLPFGRCIFWRLECLRWLLWLMLCLTVIYGRIQC